MLTEKQLLRRSQYLGGSDIAAILGHDSYRSPLQVFLEKKGRVKPFEGNRETLAGQIFEKSILELYIKSFPNASSLRPLSDEELEIVHPQHDFLVGHPDGIDEEGYIVEAKNVGPRMRSSWPHDENDVHLLPKSYRIQVLYYMALFHVNGTPIKGAKIIAYFGGSDLRVYTIPYDENAARVFIKAACDFWTHYILKDKEPDPLTFRDVASFVTVDPHASIQANLDTRILVSLIQDKDEEIKKLNKEREELKEKVALFMGENEILLDDQEHTLATFKMYTRESVNTKRLKEDGLFDTYKEEKPYRVFRLKGEKE